MKILGIDPGSRRVGWAVISLRQCATVDLDAIGSLRLEKLPDRQEKFREISCRLEYILHKHLPSLVAIEGGFVGTNAQRRAAIIVSEFRGAIVMRAVQLTSDVVEIAPATAKVACGLKGNAKKALVRQAVQRLLLLDELPGEDEADAVAVALGALAKHTGLKMGGGGER